MQPIIEAPMEIAFKNVTFEVSLGRYACSALLILCVFISAFGYFKTKKLPFMLQGIGFLMLVVYYGMSIISFAETFNDNPSSQSFLLAVNSVLGPAGIAFLAWAGIAQIRQAKPAS
ncbi:MAG: hypothetical protein WEB58_20605 [Planctomycetaceae bacterium]